jgi:hypothetical protein
MKADPAGKISNASSPVPTDLSIFTMQANLKKHIFNRFYNGYNGGANIQGKTGVYLLTPCLEDPLLTKDISA